MHCILERREHTAVANTHVEDLCVGGVAVLLNDMAKLTLSDANLTVLTTFVRKRLVANVCRIMIYGHMHCIDTCPPLSHAHAPSRVTTLPSPLADSHVAPTVYLQVDVTHICALHTLPSELLKKQKTSRTFYFSSHVTHLYYYSCGERSLGIVYCTLTKRSGARTH